MSAGRPFQLTMSVCSYDSSCFAAALLSPGMGKNGMAGVKLARSLEQTRLHRNMSIAAECEDINFNVHGNIEWVKCRISP